MQNAKTLGAIGAILLAASAADAAIVVLKSDGSPAEATEATITQSHASGAWNVTLSALYAPGGETRYVVRGNGGEVIQNVFIDVPCLANENGDCAPAGSPVFVEIHSDPPFGLTTVHNVVQTGDAETFVLLVEAEQDVGAVSAEVIGTILAGRDVLGPIVATTPDHPARGIFWIEAQRDILGDVITEEGRIGRIMAWRNIGTAADPVTIVARHRINDIIAADGPCVPTWLSGASTTCAGEIHADITTRNGGNGYLFQMIAGTFSGTLDIASLGYDTATGTPGRLGILESFDGAITVGGALDDPALTFELPPRGLTGQVTLNADGIPGAIWTTPIALGRPDDPDRIVLAGPGYPQSAADLGGGSIGLAPFALHHASCDPPTGGVLETSDPANAVVRLRHYGPVEVDGPAPVFIERRPVGSSAPWTAEPTWAFQFVVDPADPNSVLVSRAPGQPGFAADHTYRFVPLGDLRSAVPGLPAVTWAGIYQFDVASGPTACTGDLDGNGSIGMADLSVLLNAWGPAPGHPADLNPDGTINFTDLIMLLELWGPCATQG